MNLIEKYKETAALRLFGLLKIPMVFSMSPSVMESSPEKIVIKVPLNRRNKNHVNTMYVGVLAGAADVTVGYLAINAIKRSGEKVSFVIRDMKVNFLKRADGDVFFSCEDGKIIQDAVQEAINTGIRVNLPVKITAIVPSKQSEPVATFDLTISLKKK